MANNNIIIPPDSTGKRIATDELVTVDFDNQIATININDVVTGVGSGASGTVVSIIVVGFPASSGRLYLKDSNPTAWVEDEAIQVSAATKADVDLSTNPQLTLNTQNMIITDPNNPTFKQKIDKFGATLNTFEEGSPLFGPFGEIIQAEPTSISAYSFTYGLNLGEFFDSVTSGGTVTYAATASAVQLDTDTTAASNASRTSHLYHPFHSGTGNSVEMSILIGDVGKTDVDRRWGIFDANNGFFFELDALNFNVVVRSNATGSVVNTVIAQSAFNLNPLDGTDSGGFNLDVSKINSYWIDFSWPAGRVRFGVYDERGRRIVAHVHETANTGTLGVSETGSLPLRIEQDNTGTPASSSEMKWFDGSVRRIGRPLNSDKHFSAEMTTRNTLGTTEEPLISIRPATTFDPDGGTKANHAIIRLTSISISNTVAASAAMIRIHRDSTGLTSAAFAAHDATESVAEIDIAATAITPGDTIWSGFVGEEAKLIEFEQHDHGIDQSFSIILEADETTQQILTVSGDTIGSDTAGEVLVTINWIEIQ